MLIQKIFIVVTSFLFSSINGREGNYEIHPVVLAHAVSNLSHQEEQLTVTKVRALLHAENNLVNPFKLLETVEAFQPNDSASCFQNKTYHFIGNSISRSWAFALHDVLTTSDMKSEGNRTFEKSICGSGGGMPEGSYCEMKIDHLSTTIRFTWIWAVYNEHLIQALEYPVDYIVLNVGSHYAFSKFHDRVEKTEHEAMQLHTWITNHTTISEKTWIREITPLCGDNYRGTPTDQMNIALYQQNAIIYKQLFTATHNNSQEKQNKVMLHYIKTWTSQDTCKIYDDDIHSFRYAKILLIGWLQTNQKNHVCDRK